MLCLWLLHIGEKYIFGYKSFDWVLTRFHEFSFDFLKVNEEPISTKFFHMQFFSHNHLHSSLENTSRKKQWLNTSYSWMVLILVFRIFTWITIISSILFSIGSLLFKLIHPTWTYWFSQGICTNTFLQLVMLFYCWLFMGRR